MSEQEQEKERKPRQDVNVRVVSGNLTRNPERRGKVVTFGLAVHSREKIDGGTTEGTDFYEVTVFDPAADPCFEHLKKGRKVLVEGSETFDEYEAKYDNGEVIYLDEAGEEA